MLLRYAQIFVAGLCIMLAATGCARTVVQQETRVRPSVMNTPYTEVIAHRGASAYAPENTLAAFQLAIDQGADWFELDCYLSKDGEVIVIHDPTVDRTTDGTGAIADMTLEELKQLDAGSWFDPKFAGERLPTLDESLELAKGQVGVLIEIKNSDDDSALMRDIQEGFAHVPSLDEGQYQELMELIEASGTRNLPLTGAMIDIVRRLEMEDEVVIQSFSSIVCAVALHEAPEITTELLGGGSPDQPEQWENYLRMGHLFGVHGFNPNHGLLTPGRLAAFHAANKAVSVWTVNNPDDMARYARWGVDGIITDYPDVCLEVLGR